MIKALITAGPTRERIDAIRYIQNTSTGKLGIQIAKEAYKHGYDVTLIYGPGTARVPSYLQVIRVESTKDMLKEVLKRIKDVDVFISAAAVSDYSPRYQDIKIPSGMDKLTIELYPNPKIIEEARKIAGDKTIFVTFKLEYDVDEETLIERAKDTKGDIIVANDIKNIRGGHHPALILYHQKIIKAKTKKEIATIIVKLISDIIHGSEKMDEIENTT